MTKWVFSASFLVLFSFLTGSASAAATASDSLKRPSGTEVFLLDLTQEGNSISVSNPRNITNRVGYDNQPSFSSNGRYVFYTAMLEGQTDIFRYNISNQEIEQMTNTPESEYSPQMMPDKEHFSVVMVEKDSTQRLWSYPVDGSKRHLINKKMENIGYYCWIGVNNFAYFLIGKKFNSLMTATMFAKEPHHIVDWIGRCMHKIPGESYVSFVDKKQKEQWFIAKFNMYNGDLQKVIKTLPNSEDYDWTADGTLIMGSGQSLYKYKPGLDDDWVKIADLTLAGGNITRLAVDPQGKYIAIVIDEVIVEP